MVEIEQEIKVRLTLSYREAQWLKALMQNPIGCTRETEAQEDREKRKSFWDALATKGIQ